MNCYGGKNQHNIQGECCAGNLNTYFRRTSSLRLRGEKCFQRSPQSTRRYFPSITEHHQHKGSGDGAAPMQTPRPSSALTRSRAIRNYSKADNHMDSKLSISDSAHTPPGSPEDLPDDDSLHSYGSAATAASCDPNYAPFNGTTFSGRSMRYVLHCSSHAGLEGEDYLTPTQRATRHIRKLKTMLSQAKRDLEKKDSEIFQLTKEVVELRLYKASLCSPDEKSNSSEIITIKENAEDGEGLIETKDQSDETRESFDVTDGSMFKETPTRSRNSDMQSSFTDSGHFEDLTNSSLHSKDSIVHTQEAACMTESYSRDEERKQMTDFYEKKIEELLRSHFSETQDLKKAHNDKVESLLQKLADVNSRYCEILPNYEQAKEKIHALEKQLDEVMKKLSEEESKHHKLYLESCNKTEESVKFPVAKEEFDAGLSNRVSVAELLEQLEVTQTELENIRDPSYTPDVQTPMSHTLLSAKEAVSLWVLGARKAMYRSIVEAQKHSKGTIDPEVTLQFLKSAIYYFLTDPANHQGHLNAIENILGFTENEKKQIRKARTT